MKKLLSITLLALSFSSSATTKMEYCMALKTVAEQVMDLRQMGIDIDAALPAASGERNFENLIKLAWREELGKNQVEKEAAISSFGRLAYTACMGGVK